VENDFPLIVYYDIRVDRTGLGEIAYPMFTRWFAYADDYIAKILKCLRN